MEKSTDNKAHLRRAVRVSEMSSDIEAAMAPDPNGNERSVCPSGLSEPVRTGGRHRSSRQAYFGNYGACG